MTPRAADNLVGMIGIACDPAHDGREILATLRLEALDEIGTVLCVQRGIIPIVPVPDAATRRIDELMDTRDRRAGGKLGEPIFALSQDAGPRRQACPTGRGRCDAGEALERIRDFLAP